jgi:hypothetical protein
MFSFLMPGQSKKLLLDRSLQTTDAIADIGQEEPFNHALEGLPPLDSGVFSMA